MKIDARGRKVGVWGWQATVNADEDGFVRRVAASPGNRAEVDSRIAVAAGDEAALHADSAYVGPRTRALPARHGMAGRVQRRGARSHPLTEPTRAQNAGIGVTRSPVSRRSSGIGNATGASGARASRGRRRRASRPA